MNSRDFIIFVAESPDIDTDLGVLEPQEVLIMVEGKEYKVQGVWVRGDNKLIIEGE